MSSLTFWDAVFSYINKHTYRSLEIRAERTCKQRNHPHYEYSYNLYK